MSLEEKAPEVFADHGACIGETLFLKKIDLYANAASRTKALSHYIISDKPFFIPSSKRLASEALVLKGFGCLIFYILFF